MTTLLLASFLYLQSGHLFNQSCYYLDFLDVGQGDAILITTPNDKNILIDGGPGQVVIDQLGATMPWWDKTIDLLVLTHPHADHVDGLLEVMKRFQVGKVYLTGVSYPSAQNKILYELISAHELSYEFPTEETAYQIDGVNLQILYPPNPYIGRDPPENINDSSIVGLVDVDGFRFLFSGDAELDEEAELLSLPYDYHADLFQAGHHGSRTSNSPEFIDAINPTYAVIQSGADNEYGHPHRQTLDTFQERGIKILRTDLQGGVEFQVCQGKVRDIRTGQSGALPIP